MSCHNVACKVIIFLKKKSKIKELDFKQIKAHLVFHFMSDYFYYFLMLKYLRNLKNMFQKVVGTMFSEI